MFQNQEKKKKERILIGEVRVRRRREMGDILGESADLFMVGETFEWVSG